MSKIQWTERTWNPTVGCTKISPGCKHCYAEVMHHRLYAMGSNKYRQPFNKVVVHRDALDAHFGKSGTMVFVNSMSDLFHPDVPREFVCRVIDMINKNPQHTFQVLTKRADRMAEFFGGWRIPENLWLGVSVEDKKYGLPRIEYLRRIPAIVNFLSIEPLLEDLGEINLSEIDWVIVGGESGPNARPMQAEWVRNIKRQCDAAGVAFFFKQWSGPKNQGIPRLDGMQYAAYPNRK